MKEIIYVPLADEPEPDLTEIRSGVNNALVGTLGEQGLYYWERRSNMRLLLPWSEILKYYEKRQEKPLQN